MDEYVIIATWPHGRTAAAAAAAALERGQTALDAVVAGAQAVEDDPTVDSVGYGGLPDARGVVQLSASVMEGRSLECGSVAGLENVRHAAALARRVMERTPHVLLAGQGALLFALQQGFPLENLLTAESLDKWRQGSLGQERKATHWRIGPESAPTVPATGHDTVTVLARDRGGSLAGACSTSGLPHMFPGRVADSAVIGAGLYVDDSAGAAGATGEGEESIRIGASLLIVEALRGGLAPQDACDRAVRRVNAASLRRGVPPPTLSFIALDPGGQTGASCTAGTGFRYAVARPGRVDLLTAREVGPADA
jgi:N4-(beta-N-acetylglucosaminyl)-L-asparaginase